MAVGASIGLDDFKYSCPKCGEEVVEWSRVCFGHDPHVEYRCTKCFWLGRDPKFVAQYARRYGSPPIPVLDYDVSEWWQEFMTYQYLPVRLPQSEGWENSNLTFPPRLDFIYDLVTAAWNDARMFGFEDPYIYVTAKRGWATQENPLNRRGWHCDGFGTDDLNYVWCDTFPTLFAPWEFTDISDDHLLSLQQFEEQCRWRGAPKPIDPGVLYRFTPYVVHTTPSEIPAGGGMRSFLKVSVSNHRYNLVGNSKNYSLKYDWEMFPRETLRNDPHRAGLDFVEPG